MNKDTFLKLLPTLGFAKTGDVFSEMIGNATLAVDVAKEKLIYPEDKGLKVHERTTCNFSAEENFVVFECVHRLLQKGYQPAHLELEPRWQLGHGASGGRADVLVRDNAGKCPLITECKTVGREFDRAWKDTVLDGGQLFGYVEQERSTQFLCLYTSTVEDGVLRYQSHIIAHRDNEKYLTDKRLKGFKEATDRKERFAVWRDVYKLAYTPNGIFEDSVCVFVLVPTVRLRERICMGEWISEIADQSRPKDGCGSSRQIPFHGAGSGMVLRVGCHLNREVDFTLVRARPCDLVVKEEQRCCG